MKVVIPDSIEIGVVQKKQLQSLPDVTIYEDTVNDPKVIVERIKDAEIITANFIDLITEIINQSPRLKYIISPAVGYDWINVKAATDREIKVLHCPTFNSQAVAEHAIALMFAVYRNIFRAQQSILHGEYKQREFIGLEAKGKLLVTFGYGNIGKKIVDMARGLGMDVAWINTKTNTKETDELISKADVLVMCLPLSESTKGILDEKRINMLKSSAIVINVARGLVIEQNTFYKALREKKILGAGIDTFAKDETITQPTKDILEFAKLPNVVATPHIAYNTQEAIQRLGEELLQNINSCLQNRPINVVN